MLFDRRRRLLLRYLGLALCDRLRPLLERYRLLLCDRNRDCENDRLLEKLLGLREKDLFLEDDLSLDLGLIRSLLTSSDCDRPLDRFLPGVQLRARPLLNDRLRLNDRLPDADLYRPLLHERLLDGVLPRVVTAFIGMAFDIDTDRFLVREPDRLPLRCFILCWFLSNPTDDLDLLLGPPDLDRERLWLESCLPRDPDLLREFDRCEL